MRKIFIALAASLLVAVGSAAKINQIPGRSLAQALKENNDKHEQRPVSVVKLCEEKERGKRAQKEAGDEDDEEEEGDKEEEGDGDIWWGENQNIDFDEQDNDFVFDEHKNAQGFLGVLETAVNDGDEVAKIINPTIPTANLSNKGNTVTVKI